MPSKKEKKPRFGDAWKNVKSDPAEMEDLFSKFVKQPSKEPSSVAADLNPISTQIKTDQDRLASIPYQDPTRYRIDTVSDSDTVSESDMALRTNRESAVDTVLKSDMDRGYTKVPNRIFDQLLRTLDTDEQALYLRLYRLSYGFNQTTCTVGLEALINATNIKRTVLREAIKRLVNRGLIEIINIYNSKNMKGTEYRVYTNLKFGTMSNFDTVSESDTVSKTDRVPKTDAVSDSDTNKRDHDDLQKKDPHQSAAMKIYQSITSNSWTRADDKSYSKIKHIPLAHIENTLRSVIDRAKDRPRSLNYFVSEILSGGQGREVRTKAERRALEKIVLQVRDLHVGGDFEGFRSHVEKECLRKGIVFDLDLFNEIFGGVR